MEQLGTDSRASEASSRSPESLTSEERLARSEVWLALAQRVAHVGSFEWELSSGKVTWSDELYRIYGVSPGDFDGTYEAFLSRVHPDDLERTRQLVTRAMKTGEPLAYEHRIIRSDGASRELRTQGAIIADDDGHPVRLIGSCWDVTEVNESRRELEGALSLLKSTLEATDDGLLVVDREGEITQLNQRFLSLWRLPSALARRRDDQLLLAQVMDQLENPDAFLLGVQTLYAHPEQNSFDILRFKDGRVFERYSTPQRVGADIVGRVWSFRDVTERERLLRLATFLADATRLLASLDVEPALEAVARLAVPLLGDCCVVDLLADGAPRRLAAAWREGSEPIALDIPAAVLAGHSAIYTLGKRSCLATPLRSQERVAGALGLVAKPALEYETDDLKFAETLSRRMALSLDNARLYRQAREALLVRDEFLGIVAHEIRGPLNSVHLAIQGVRSGRIPAAQLPQAMALAERENRRLARFVDELMDIGHIRGGTLRFVFEEFEFPEAVHQALEYLGEDLAKSHSSLAFEARGPMRGQWDRFRIVQIVQNLVSNAIKFGLGKPIVIDVEGREGDVRLSVVDHGIGIPSSEQSRVFAPFERAVSARHYGGLGLGLFIVRTITENSGGTVSVDSSPGAGATFTVLLPRTPPKVAS